MTNLLLLNHFYPYEFKEKATNRCIRYWSLVMVRNQLAAQVVKQNVWGNRLEISLIISSLSCKHLKG